MLWMCLALAIFVGWFEVRYQQKRQIAGAARLKLRVPGIHLPLIITGFALFAAFNAAQKGWSMPEGPERSKALESSAVWVMLTLINLPQALRSRWILHEQALVTPTQVVAWEKMTGFRLVPEKSQLQLQIGPYTYRNHYNPAQSEALQQFFTGRVPELPPSEKDKKPS